jgi:hypothetical protein
MISCSCSTGGTTRRDELGHFLAGQWMLRAPVSSVTRWGLRPGQRDRRATAPPLPFRMRRPTSSSRSAALTIPPTASIDPRIKAAVAIGPWGMQAGFWDEAGWLNPHAHAVRRGQR